MAETFPPDENELSAEDLAILRAFTEKDDWTVDTPEPINTFQSAEELSEDDSAHWQTVFAVEVDEDIERMRLALSQLEVEEHLDPARFATLQRAAHKIRGAAGTVGCENMAQIAFYIETVAEHITRGLLFPVLGLPVLTQAVAALELALQHLLTEGHEDDLPLGELETLFHALDGEISQSPEDEMPAEESALESAAFTEEREPTRTTSRALQNPSMPFIRVAAQRVDQLVQHSEHLTALHAPLESAQEQLEHALQELRTAQTRLRHLQPQLSSLLYSERPLSLVDGHAPSSLVSRVLQQSLQHSENGRKSRVEARSNQTAGSTKWDRLNDELNMERYSEKDMLIRTLTEAISDVAIATAHVDTASTTLLARQQEYIAQVAEMHSSALLLRLAPLKSLVSRLQHVVTTSSLARAHTLEFNVSGENTEVDQGILDSLTYPLVQMVRICLADIVASPATAQPFQLWLYAQEIGNEIMLEIGFSMPVNCGALEVIQEPIQRLNGSYTLHRNETGGISFLLRFPRSHGMAQCLQVRAGSQHLLVPFSQVQWIEEYKQKQPDMLYHLADLLGFPRQSSPSTRIQPVLILSQALSSRYRIGVLVDEVLGETEVMLKPLAPYLQRPGISGSAIDGHGNLLLMLHLPELLRTYGQHRYQTSDAGASHTVREKHTTSPRILVADDSVSLRRWLGETLRQAHYTVQEATDGMDALERMQESPPDLCLLDIEMPMLNGFELLDILQHHPQLAHVKVAMLSSRSSDKHIQRARELGALAYLIKPCAQDTLLETVQELLVR